jgi:Immunoglobulin-like domain of bacterial spore germination/Sporulation and spore germination
MKRLPIIIISVGLLAACGTSQSGALGTVPTDQPAASATQAGKPTGTAQPSSGPQESTSAPAATSTTQPAQSAPASSPATQPAQTQGPTGQVGLQAWFTRQGKLFVTQRSVPATASIGKAALDRLLAGPSAAESAAGLRSQIPAGTQVLGLRIVSGTATVNLNSSFVSAASSSTMPLRIAQVVDTLGQFPTVSGVRFQINGQGVTVLGGVPVQNPQTPSMYSGYLPPITVQNPVIGEQVTSPVTVSGTADVFEAVVSVRVLNSAGVQIAGTFGNASCGTGCRGSYSVPVSYSVPHAEPGTIEVFESSPKNGQPVNVQLIPVMLEP